MSASLVAIDIGIQSLKEKRSVDVHSIVKGIRKDRAGAIQVFDQYKFIYRVCARPFTRASVSAH